MGDINLLLTLTLQFSGHSEEKQQLLSSGKTSSHQAQYKPIKHCCVQKFRSNWWTSKTFPSVSMCRREHGAHPPLQPPPSIFQSTGECASPSNSSLRLQVSQKLGLRTHLSRHSLSGPRQVQGWSGRPAITKCHRLSCLMREIYFFS